MSYTNMTELNYPEWSAHRSLIKRWGRILVVYPTGSTVDLQNREGDDLAGFYFLREDGDFKAFLTKKLLNGLIMEPGTSLTKDQLSCILPRMLTEAAGWVIILDEKQTSTLRSHLAEMRAQRQYPEELDKFMKYINQGLERGQLLREFWKV